MSEVILVLVISSLTIAALLAGLVALVGGLQPPRVTLSGEPLSLAPTFGAFPAAVALHQTLSDHVTSGRAVYVFGGSHLSIPPGAPEAGVKPLRRQGLPSLDVTDDRLTLDARSFLERHSTKLGEQETGGSPEDFTVLVIGPHDEKLVGTCLVQVRRTHHVVSDGTASVPYVARDVRLWDIRGNELRYAFAERPAVSSAVPVGAVHTWLRYHAGGIAEEGPACVAFPDPWVYAGARGRPDDVPPFSRFIYFLATSP